MRVVVVDLDVPRFPTPLEATRSSAKLGELGCSLLTRHPGELERRQSSRSVPAVVQPWHGERPVVRRQILTAHDLGDVREPFVEELLDLGSRAERRVVVEVDVRHDRDARPQCGDGAVGFVALDDEPARPGPGVAAELRNIRSDQPRRLAAETLEAERDHPARRRLAVRPGNHDRVAQRDELGQELGARLARNAPGKGRRDVRLPAFRRHGWVIRDLDLIPSRCWRYGVSKRSQPRTSAPHARARSA